jgi:N6-L-threonylcarbamoyladenine synthase
MYTISGNAINTKAITTSVKTFFLIPLVADCVDVCFVSNNWFLKDLLLKSYPAFHPETWWQIGCFLYNEFSKSKLILFPAYQGVAVYLNRMEHKKDVIILGIESSCDDTSAAVIHNRKMLSNEVAGQSVHKAYGGVVPELASRAHQQNIIPVVDMALKKAGVSVADIDAIAFTRGPGLLGSLLVGVSFAKAFSLARNIPLIEVNHLQGHVLAHFLSETDELVSGPSFPFLCLLVSGGNSQIILVRDYLDMEVIGQTIDDAAGEAFDKCAKVMGLPYPGGPLIDKLAKSGDPKAFVFSKPRIPGLDYSFSGLKTSFLYLLRDALAKDPDFIDNHKEDLCASLQYTIIEILLAKLKLAANQTGIRDIAVAGGVSANSGLRSALIQTAEQMKWNMFIPPFKFTTDNAAMIAITGYFKYLNREFANQDCVPFSRVNIR